MSLAKDILADVTAWGEDAVKLATSAIPVVGTVEDAVKTLENVSQILATWQAANNTPAMQNASSAQKLQSFKDHVDTLMAQGDEADLEKLESSS